MAIDVQSPTLLLDKKWPQLDRLSLSLLELQRDPYYSFLVEDEPTSYVEQAIKIGVQAATPYIAMEQLTFFNRLLQAGLRIQLYERHPEQATIRAQYLRQNRTIAIYRNSIREIKQRLQAANELDLLALHAYHEWFHHLETTKIGRTDRQLPAVIIRKRGPFMVKRRLSRLREIAAHAFTQTALQLDWSPLVFDQYR